MTLASPLPVPNGGHEQALRVPKPGRVDIYFSADVETDGPIPGPYSMLAMGIAVAGTFDGKVFRRPAERLTFYRELQPISHRFQSEALRVNGLDRNALVHSGMSPTLAMREASEWIAKMAEDAEPVLVAYPLSFDWTWLYWYFMNFLEESPFNHSRCFDVKTAFAVKAGLPISGAGRAKLPKELLPEVPHTHNALDDAVEQAEIFARVFTWDGELTGRD